MDRNVIGFAQLVKCHIVKNKCYLYILSSKVTKQVDIRYETLTLAMPTMSSIIPCGNCGADPTS